MNENRAVTTYHKSARSINAVSVAVVVRVVLLLVRCLFIMVVYDLSLWYLCVVLSVIVLIYVMIVSPCAQGGSYRFI